MKQRGFTPIIILVLITLVALGYFGYKNYWPKISVMVSPQNYEECLKDPGSLLQESFPATCVAKSGARFTQPLTPDQQQNLIPPVGASCQYNGITYKNGEAVSSGDKCNSCSCDNGQVACTAMACQ